MDQPDGASSRGLATAERGDKRRSAASLQTMPAPGLATALTARAYRIPLIISEVVKAATIEHQVEGVADAELLEPADISLHPVDLYSSRPSTHSRLAQSLLHTIDRGDRPALLCQIHGVAAGATADIECSPHDEGWCAYLATAKWLVG